MFLINVCRAEAPRLRAGAAYMHYCDNESIQGVELKARKVLILTVTLGLLGMRKT